MALPFYEHFKRYSLIFKIHTFIESSHQPGIDENYGDIEPCYRQMLAAGTEKEYCCQGNDEDPDFQ